MNTLTDHRPGTAQGVLHAVDALGPVLTARAREIEDGRRVPADLLEQVVATGCFRMLLPASHGGLGLPLPSAVEIVERVSRAEPSVGWTVMIGSAAWLDLAGLPRATFDRLYADGPDVIVAGAFSPSGVATPTDGGYRVSGRWGFVSGCQHAHWLYGNCVERSQGEQRLRIALFRPEEATIEDTWHVVGLRGTGSHHVRVDDLVVPADRTCALFEDPLALDDPIVRVPTPSLFALQVAAVAVGTARGALDEALAVAAAKVPLLASGRLATSPTFQHQLADADTTLRAARALLLDVAEEAWRAAGRGLDLTVHERARIRAAAAWAVARASDVVTSAYHAGGGSALYLDHPLQRRLRDVHAVTQHFLVRADTLTTAGAVLAGQDIDVPVF